MSKSESKFQSNRYTNPIDGMMCPYGNKIAIYRNGFWHVLSDNGHLIKISNEENKEYAK